jgi:hypothetical protein
VTGSRRALMLHGLLAPVAGCATASSRVHIPSRDAGPGSEIVLRQRTWRGSAWTWLKVRLPQITALDSQMRIQDGRIFGFHQGAPVKLKASADEITGWGPGGAVEMEVWGTDGDLVVDGLWNGKWGRLKADSLGLRVLAGSSSFAFERRGQGFYVGAPKSETDPQTWLELQTGVVAALKREELSTLLLLMLSRPPLPT